MNPTMARNLHAEAVTLENGAVAIYCYEGFEPVAILRANDPQFVDWAIDIFVNHGVALLPLLREVLA